jgi:hypothetical protein
VLAYCDAARSGTYGQGGYLAGLCIHQLDGTMLYFITEWHSASLKRVAFSSTDAEILAAANQQTAASLSPPSFVNLLLRQKISCLNWLSTLVGFLTQWRLCMREETFDHALPSVASAMHFHMAKST